ncbi:gliding motility protein [Streptomyces sp. NBC_00996]|uniref:gliding motility protein n=1 Tax=Streptomyces sp. NBC_00996 TaxID=2903710 RepID=UPI00386DB849
MAEQAKGSSPTEGEATAEETTEAATAEDVDIPQQQTAEKAADNEAGEGARK